MEGSFVEEVLTQWTCNSCDSTISAASPMRPMSPSWLELLFMLEER